MKEDDEAIVIDSPSSEPTNDHNDAASTAGDNGKPKSDKKPASPAQAKAAKRKKYKKKKKSSKQFEETEDSLEGKKMLSKLTKRHGRKHKKSGKGGSSSSVHTGPFIEVNGPREYPTSCKVININSATGEYEVGDKKKKGKKQELSVDVTQPMSLVMDNSEPWQCTFCHHERHFKGLGDLFGPYHLDGLSSPPPSPGKMPSPSKKRPHESAHMDDKSKKQKLLMKKEESRGFTKADLPTEIWVHEDCAVWASGVYCTGSQLHGLQDAVANAVQARCCVCKTFGASFGCFYKNCQKKYHYICAMDEDCALDSEKFCMTCPTHNGKLNP